MIENKILYCDPGIINSVGHNMQTIQCLIKYFPSIEVLAGKAYIGSDAKFRSIFRHGSPHYSIKNKIIKLLEKFDSNRFILYKKIIHYIKLYQTIRDLSIVNTKYNNIVIINSVELDDAYRIMQAFSFRKKGLKFKIILHYSPFKHDSLEIRDHIQVILNKMVLASKKNDVIYFADTEYLIDIYSLILKVNVKSIPFPHLQREIVSNKKNSNVIGIFGTYTETKSIHLIPQIIREMKIKNVPWNIQCTYITKNRVVEDLEKTLQILPFVSYRTGPFDGIEVDKFYAYSSIILLLYHSHDYEIQSSGIFMETIASGNIPVISSSMYDAQIIERIDPKLVYIPNNIYSIAEALDYAVLNFEKIRDNFVDLKLKILSANTPKKFISVLLA